MAWPMQRQKRFEEKRLLAANKNKNIFFFIIENMFGSTLKHIICLTFLCPWPLKVFKEFKDGCIWYLGLVPRGCIYHVRGVYPVAFVAGWLGCVSQFPKVQI